MFHCILDGKESAKSILMLGSHLQAKFESNGGKAERNLVISDFFNNWLQAINNDYFMLTS
jgi:hypothetical protein